MRTDMSIPFIVGLAIASLRPHSAGAHVRRRPGAAAGARCRPLDAADRRCQRPADVPAGVQRSIRARWASVAADGIGPMHVPARRMPARCGHGTDRADPMAPMARCRPWLPMPAWHRWPWAVAFAEQDREAERQDREREQKERELQRAQSERDRESSLYEQGNNALYEGRWDARVSYFARLADMKGTRADSALYWKAYAQNRLGQRAECARDDRRADQELSEEPLHQGGQGARSRSPRSERAAGQSRGAGGRGSEDLSRCNALRNSDPAQAVPHAREAARRHRVAAAEGPGALRARAEQHARAPAKS